MTAGGNVIPLHQVRLVPDDEAAERLSAQVREEWMAWLAENTGPAWRPGEWDGSTLLFTGDPTNPSTAVFHCGVDACNNLIKARGLCDTCARARRATGLPIKEFMAVHVPERNRSIGGERVTCLVLGCPRDSLLWGLCNAHGSKRHKELLRDPESDLREWITRQQPYEAVAPCVVAGCRYDSRATFGLCDNHADAWRNHLGAIGRSSQGSTVDRQWLERQAPYLSVHQFSLAPLAPLVRAEMLYALSQREVNRQKIDPTAVRQAVSRLVGAVECIAVGDPAWLPERMQANVSSLVRETFRVVAAAFDRFRGLDPAAKPVLDLSELGVKGIRGGLKTTRPGSLDVSQIRQSWLRQMLVSWITDVQPTTSDVRRGHRACTAASRALEMRPGGGEDPAMLSFADMNAVVDTFRHLLKVDGSGPMGSKQRGTLLSTFFKILDHNRAAGHLDGMSARFARHSSHVIKNEDVNEDEPGSALPESVIAQLNRNTDLLGLGVSHGRMEPHEVQAMARAVYELLRDTGRRPYEIAELRVDCLTYVSGTDAKGEKLGGWELIWDNRKAGRNGRHLPIYPETANTIKTWKQIRAGLDLPLGADDYLFPPAGDNGILRHLNSDHVSNLIRTWADSIPELLSEELDQEGNQLPFDRSLIFPYAFRHSYCQRHADAGVRIEVLCELMDHKSTVTTQGYYRVTQKRMREAINVLRKLTVDRNGNEAPFASTTAYELGTVPVPFGNCSDPRNVKAGGKGCPIRFQCAACPAYRPDPSYLPVIADHIRSLKENREIAVSMEVAEFVIVNMNQEIEAFKGVLKTMKHLMESMGTEERAEVEEAAAVLRKVRAGRPSTWLPDPVFPGERDERSA
ncbi:site-specific integrase [Kitasatospora sp. NPDC050463]|uniref:tyrosine-type recombinase/integrase n=1 Tax=Kitasatospora sp. NPDC050463 TaxID=3155786 RepID=UPI0033BFDCC2